MPEGDSLHRAARALQVLVGERVAVETPHPQAAATQLAPRLDGLRLETAEAVGKNLLLGFEGGLVLRTHLRMRGRWQVRPRGEPLRGRPWLVLASPTHEALLWNGPVLELTRRSPKRLGPDILADPPDLPGMVAGLRRADQSRELGEALLAPLSLPALLLPGRVFRAGRGRRGGRRDPVRVRRARERPWADLALRVPAAAPLLRAGAGRAPRRARGRAVRDRGAARRARRRDLRRRAPGQARRGWRRGAAAHDSAAAARGRDRVGRRDRLARRLLRSRLRGLRAHAVGRTARLCRARRVGGALGRLTAASGGWPAGPLGRRRRAGRSLAGGVRAAASRLRPRARPALRARGRADPFARGTRRTGRACRARGRRQRTASGHRCAGRCG